MKSSASIFTDSIENRSLPSLPTHSELNEQFNLLPSSNKDVSLGQKPNPHYSSFPNTSSKFPPKLTSMGKQSKSRELNKINEYAVLKVFEHRNFGNSPSNYSRMSEDISVPNLPTCRSYLQNRNRFISPSLKSHYCSIELTNEGLYGHKAPNGCVYLPKLNLKEIEFLELIAENNVNAVETYLLNNPSTNINCVNFQGISALHIAVHNKSEEMVEFLLKYPHVEICDTVLHAIRDNSLKIMVALMDAQKKICPGLEYAGAARSTIFPAHVTPLILASELNYYEIVSLLLSRGHKVTRPHSPNCHCTICNCPLWLSDIFLRSAMVNGDALHGSCARLSIYRAISSPVYMTHVTSDPILEAFYLTRELAANAAAYRHLATEYLKLSDDVSAFAKELIGCCRSSDEVEIILKQTSGTGHRRHFILPRLLMAVNYRQKEFVAHPNPQQVLESYWMGDWYGWRNKSLLSKAILILCRIFTMPLILLLCLVLPRHRLLKHYQIPLNKLITHVAAYFVFLGLVFYVSNQDKSKQKRGPPNTGAEGPLILFVIGYTWSAIRMCFMQGPRRFFTALWNWAEVIMLTLFWLTFVFWVMAAIDAVANGNKLERKYWNQYNPTLLAEGTFCLATIFAFFRLMFLCQLNYHLGPLQVSLGKMTIDIYKYIIVFTIIISAFAAGLARFYQYYSGMVNEDEFGMKTVQVSSFTSLIDTLNTLFWALFCMAPLESADIVLENNKSNGRIMHKTQENRHGYTERIGYFCFGCFEVISVIVVLNMLIATMSNTFQRVNDNVAIEWTFGKTEVYIDYMWQTTLPSPLNLVPTASGISDVIEWLRIKFCKCKGAHALCSLANCCFIERDMDEKNEKEFPALMSVLVQRYFSVKNSKLMKKS